MITAILFLLYGCDQPPMRNIVTRTDTYMITDVQYYKYKQTERVYVDLVRSDDEAFKFKQIYVTNTFTCNAIIKNGIYLRLTTINYDRDGKKYTDFDSEYLERCLCSGNCEDNL